ncbi:MAG: metal ABC transporter substrate-binding protein [Candidatus Saccharimonas sp.]
MKYWKYVAVAAGLIVVGYIIFGVVQVRSERSNNQKLQVLTTFTVLADMTQNVAGNYADVSSITKPGAEIHGYEPTPQDTVRMKDADLILDNGMNLEKWAEKLYQNAPDVPHVTLTSAITPIGIAEGPYKDKPNPHAWMSPANALVYVDTIAAALGKYDTKNATNYKANAAEYKAKIQQLDTRLRHEIADLPQSNRYLVTCEGAFAYLTRDYGLKERYLWPINADAQGTPQQIAAIVDEVKANNVPVVFCESTVSSKAQEQVAKETGARFGGVFYVDSLSGSNGPTPTYLKMLEYNVDTFLKAVRN